MKQKTNKPKFLKSKEKDGTKNKAKNYFYNRKGLSEDGVKAMKTRNAAKKTIGNKAREQVKCVADGEYILTPSSYDESFKGVIKSDSAEFIVDGAIVGEKERVKVRRKKGNVYYADFVNSDEPSPCRREVKCRNFLSCGNCAFLHLNYDEQLKLKKNVVKEAVEPYYMKTADVVSTGEFAYRNKAHLAFAEKNRKLILGFFDDVTRAVIPASGCLLHGEWFSVASKIILEWARERSFHAYNPRTGKGLLRFALLRRLGNNLMLMLVVNGGRLSGTDGLYEKLCDKFDKVSLYTCENKTAGSGVLTGKIRYVAGEERLNGEMLGVKFGLSPDSFFQVNERMAERIYSDVLEIINGSEAKNVVDCFSGIGITTALFARSGKRVISIEITPSAVRDAKKIGAINDLSTGISYLCGDVGRKLAEIRNAEDSVFFVDPPRSGLGEKTVLTITNFSPKEVVYLSCGPKALKEDVKTFIDNGYKIVSVTPYDLFPQTSHIETLVVLSHKKPDSHLEAKIDFDNTSLDKTAIAERAEKRKPQEKTTYKKIQEWIEENYGFKVHTAYVAEVKRELGLPMYDAPNAVDELKRPRQHPTEQMTIAIKAALKHFEII